MRPDFSTLYDLYVTQELHQREVAERLGASQQQVSHWLIEAGIARRDLRNLASRNIHKPDASELERLYLVEYLTTRQIAAQLGVVPTAVKQWLKKYDITRRPAHKGMTSRGITPPTREELYHFIHVEHLGYRQIAAKYGIHFGSIAYWLKKYNIEPPTVWDTRTKGNRPTPPDREELSALYESGLSLTDIGDLFGLSQQTITRLCRKYGIERRPDGWDGGKRFLCQDGHMVRSTYEQRVDDWLFMHEIEHTYEPPLPCDRRYKADFLANGYYIEIWGVTQNSQYKERMQKKRTLYRQHSYPLIEIGVSLFQTKHRKYLENRLMRVCTPSLFPE